MKRPACVRILALLAPLAAMPLARAAPDGIVLSVARGATVGDILLAWTGAPAGPCTVYRSSRYSPNAGIGNALTTTTATAWTDRPPAGGVSFYEVTVAPFWTRD